MIPTWQEFLAQQGARLDAGRVLDFGHPSEELATAQSGTVVADLSQLGLLVFSGEDAAEFLQNQFTNDVRSLNIHEARWNGYCSAKGRLFANFLLWRSGADICLQLSGDIREAVLKRLKMFILRAKVSAKDATDDYVRLVVAGPRASTAVAESGLALADEPMKTAANEQGLAIRLSADKFVLVLSPDKAATIWHSLSKHATPVGTTVWDWLRLTNGIPMITAATQEEFVPQMINWEVLGGVSFGKGCYPGQEIVARTQYLGKLKRRMYLAHLDSAESPKSGDAVYTPDLAGQSCGMVVNAAPAPEGGFDVLVVAPIESVVANHPLHWKSADGPVLSLKTQPYALP